MIITTRNFIFKEENKMDMQIDNIQQPNIPKINNYEKKKYNYFIKEFYI
jgi:hypothetical protein